MDFFTLIHQGVLYLHLVAFAIAFSAVLREDLALLKARSIDLRRLTRTARTLTAALAALWLTGVGLLMFDFGTDWFAFVAAPKPMAKLLVVSALTANGMALHSLAFPRLRGPRGGQAASAVLPVVLGATSSASWVYASFMGVARIVAPAMSLRDFMLLYLALLVATVGGALLFVWPRVARLLSAAH